MTTPVPKVERWPDDKPLGATAVEERMKTEGLPFYRWSNGPGDVYPAHDHVYGKVIFVVRGEITFGLPQSGEQITLHAGDRLDLPAGTVHNAEAGDQGVVCLEGHR